MSSQPMIDKPGGLEDLSSATKPRKDHEVGFLAKSLRPLSGFCKLSSSEEDCACTRGGTCRLNSHHVLIYNTQRQVFVWKNASNSFAPSSGHHRH